MNDLLSRFKFDIISSVVSFLVNASMFGPTIVTAIKDRVVILGTKFVKATCAAAGRYYSPFHSQKGIQNGSNYQA